MQYTVISLGLLASYLLGSVPFGLIVSRIYGVNIRESGSGNIGATNVFRSVGKKQGIFTFVMDMMKGFIPAFVLPKLAMHFGIYDKRLLLGLMCGCAAVAGHNWPVFLKFKGGKGVATSAGMLLGIAPKAMGIGLLVWVITFLASGFVSLASVIAAISVPVSGWILYVGYGLLLPATLTIVAGAIVFKHRSNIQRLRNGTENRFDPLKRKKK